MKIMVTGANGFVGKNLLAHFMERKDIEVLPVTRQSSRQDLISAAGVADFVFHLAGVNRPTNPAEFATDNVELTQSLCEALVVAGRAVPVVYTSSTQAERDNPYGVSKRAGEQVLCAYAEKTGAAALVYRLPNVFGKWCRPNYNSVVATFCYNIAHSLPIQINDVAAPLSLVYIDNVVAAFMAELVTMPTGGFDFRETEPVYMTTVGQLAEQITAFRDSRDSLVTERVGTGFVRALYATYTSYLPTESFAYNVPKHGDAKGVFVEMLKTPDCGQFSFFTAHPGITRGIHYHHSKTEKFLVIKGQARFRFRHIITDETFELCTSGDTPRIVETVPGWSHDITNIGKDEMAVMLWANEIFDRARPDTFSHKV